MPQPATITTTPCSPLASLYTDSTLTVPAPNPLLSDGLGNYHFYAAPGTYTVQVYGPGINTYTMTDVILPINPTNPNFGNLSALTLSLGGNLSVGGNANITGSLTAGSLNFGSFNPSTISTGTLSVTGTNTLATSGNVQLKPQPPSDIVNTTKGENIVYASPNGPIRMTASPGARPASRSITPTSSCQSGNSPSAPAAARLIFLRERRWAGPSRIKGFG